MKNNPVSRFDAVILANGDYPTHPLPLRLLQEARLLCCCDGAAQSALRRGLSPDAVVGDGDSLTKETKRQLAGKFHHIAEQDYNDLTKATRFCIAKGCDTIAYVGATGKREDHAIGNIFLLEHYARTFGITPVMFTDHGTFRAISPGTTLFQSFPRQQVSIFNISCSAIESDGLRWHSYPYSELWQGTLNEALGNSFTLHTDGSCIIFQTYDPK